MLQCIVRNSESSKLYVIVLALTNIILLLAVLIGLLRLRRDGSGTFGIGLLLWKQVRSTPLLSLQSIEMFSVCKGILWFLLATVAGAPPAVRSASSFADNLVSRRVTSQVFIILNLNSIYPLLSFMSRTNAEQFNYVVNTRSTQPRTFFLVTTVSLCGTALIRISDVSASLGGNHDHRCDEDVSLSVGLCLRYHTHVRILTSIFPHVLIQDICR